MFYAQSTIAVISWAGKGLKFAKETYRIFVQKLYTCLSDINLKQCRRLHDYWVNDKGKSLKLIVDERRSKTPNQNGTVYVVFDYVIMLTMPDYADTETGEETIALHRGFRA